MGGDEIWLLLQNHVSPFISFNKEKKLKDGSEKDILKRQSGVQTGSLISEEWRQARRHGARGATSLEKWIKGQRGGSEPASAMILIGYIRSYIH